MPNRHIHLSGSQFSAARSAVHAAMHQWVLPDQQRQGEYGRVFVTVSRQSGTNGAEFAHALATRLNADLSSPEMRWTAWDQELIEKVSSDLHLSKEIVDQIENRPHNWLEEIGAAFAGDAVNQTSEFRVYRRIAATMRALAEVGHAVLVGRGGRWVTRTMPAGLHLRLVAPRQHRIEATAELLKISHERAVERVDEVDRNRVRFFARYWPGHSLEPESFALTLNTAEMTVPEMVECVAPLIRARELAEKVATY